MMKFQAVKMAAVKLVRDWQSTSGHRYVFSKCVRQILCGCGIAAILYAPDAQAAASFTGLTVAKVGMANTSSAEIAYVVFTVATIPGSIACSDADNMMAFDVSTSKGKAMLSILTAALLSGKQVNGRGDSVCEDVTIGATTLHAERLTVIDVEQ